MRVLVLAGGNSTEREISLVSGAMVANALIGKGYEVLLCDLSFGMDVIPENPGQLFVKTPYPIPELPKKKPDLSGLRKMPLWGKNLDLLCRTADKVFPVLHGGIGEDGRLQAVLECLQVDFVGSGSAGCTLAMRKDLSKRLFESVGIPTPKWIFGRPGEISVSDVKTEIGYPCVVKPNAGGSSVGVRMAEDAGKLKKALAEIEAENGTAEVLVEKRIAGREFTVGILNGKVLPAVEIIPKNGFYDYKNKYNGSTAEICPADLSAAVFQKMSDYAVTGAKILGLKDFCRFDFLMDGEQNLWCLEANAMPGMTPTSLFPLEASKIGIDYADVCEKMLLGKSIKVDGSDE